MVDLDKVMTTVTADLAAADVKATTDPDKVRAPGVWVTAESVDLDRLSDAATVRVVLVLVVPDLNAKRAWSALSALLAAVSAVWPVAPGARVDVDSLTLPGSSAPLPALVYPVDVDWTP